MKYAITTLLLLVTTTVYAQNAKDAYRLFSEDVSVTLLKTKEIKPGYTQFLSTTPDYVDRQLIKMQVDNFINRYSDIVLAEPWEIVDGSLVVVLALIDNNKAIAGIRIIYTDNGGLGFEYINLKGKEV